MSDKCNVIEVNGIRYVREDSAASTPDLSVDGMPYVIVRSRGDGVKCGYLAGQSGQMVRLRRARQLWRWDSRFVLADLAEHGPRDASKCQFSCEVTSGDTLMLEACGVLPCSAKAGRALRSVKAQGE